MEDYLCMGHMEDVIESEKPEITYYIPHHYVFGIELSITLICIVFDAVSLTSTGRSVKNLPFKRGTIQDSNQNTNSFLKYILEKCNV